MAHSFLEAINYKKAKKAVREKAERRKKEKAYQWIGKVAPAFASSIEQKLDEEIQAGHLGYKGDDDWTNVISITVKDIYDCDKVLGKLLADELKKILESAYLPLGWGNIDINWNRYEWEGKTFHVVLEGTERIPL